MSELTVLFMPESAYGPARWTDSSATPGSARHWARRRPRSGGAAASAGRPTSSSRPPEITAD